MSILSKALQKNDNKSGVQELINGKTVEEIAEMFDVDNQETLNTVLMNAAFYSHKEIVDALLLKGANVNYSDINGNTALIFAAQNGHKEIVDALLENGANVNHSDKNYGSTALTLAAQNGHKEIVDALLLKGANVNHSNENYGKTALTLAAKNGHKEVVDALLVKEANVNHRDNNGKTALYYAKNDEIRKIIQIYPGLLSLISKEEVVDKDIKYFKDHFNDLSESTQLHCINNMRSQLLRNLAKELFIKSIANDLNKLKTHAALLKDNPFLCSLIPDENLKKLQQENSLAIERGTNFEESKNYHDAIKTVPKDKIKPLSLTYASEAIERGDNNLLSSVLTGSVHLSQKEKDTLLRQAFAKRNIESMQLLLESKADYTKLNLEKLRMNDKEDKKVYDFLKSYGVKMKSDDPAKEEIITRIKSHQLKELKAVLDKDNTEMRALRTALNEIDLNKYKADINIVLSKMDLSAQENKEFVSFLFKKGFDINNFEIAQYKKVFEQYKDKFQSFSSKENVEATIKIIDEVIGNTKPSEKVDCEQIYEKMKQAKLIPKKVTPQEKKSIMKKITKLTSDYNHEHRSHNILRRAVRSLLHFLGVKYVGKKEAISLLAKINLQKELKEGHDKSDHDGHKKPAPTPIVGSSLSPNGGKNIIR